MPQPKIATTSRPREYETIDVLSPDVFHENAQKVSNRLEEVVGREGGKLTLVESWGRRQLAYAVSRYRRGVYVCFKFVGGGRLVAEIERNLRMLEPVIKYQTVKIREDVDLSSLEVDPEAVKFEPVEPPEEEEAEESLARTLGLEEVPRHDAHAYHQRARDAEDERGEDDPYEEGAEADGAEPPTAGDEGSLPEDES